MFISQDQIKEIVETANRTIIVGDKEEILGLDCAISSYLQSLPYYQKLDDAHRLLLSAKKDIVAFLENGIDDNTESMQKACRKKMETLPNAIDTQRQNVFMLKANLAQGKRQIVNLVSRYISSHDDTLKKARQIAKEMYKIKLLCVSINDMTMYNAMVDNMGNSHETQLALSLIEQGYGKTDEEIEKDDSTKPETLDVSPLDALAKNAKD